MEILDIKVLNGPNYWTNHWKKLIVIEIDLKECKDIFSLTPDFAEKIFKILPSLDQHYCIKGCRGGFLQILKEGTDLGHVIEHIALELQSLAGMECGYGQTQATARPDVYKVIFSYEIEDAGIYAANAAVQIVKYLIKYGEYTAIANDILQLKKIKSLQGLSVGTKALVAEALARNIPVMELTAESLIMLGQSCKQKLLGRIGVNITADKKQIKAILKAAQLMVEKPTNGNHFRFLVINYELAAVAQRLPACIIGNGVSTIKALIDEVNLDPRRGEGRENILTKINLDETTAKILNELGFTTETVLEKGYKLVLKNTINLSAGGTSIDVTDIVHPQTRFIAERVARLFHLDVCGVDMVMERVDFPFTEKNGAIIGVNATPSLRMHLKPSVGVGRNVAKNIIDMLYPAGSVCRVPIIAVSGANGKSITTQLIAYFAQKTGYFVGYCNSNGVYIHNQYICSSECGGAHIAKIILRDPLVNFAVFESHQKDILNSGLGFDHCNISIIENSENIAELKRINWIIAQSTLKEGYAILNADNDIVYSIKDELECHLALFSLHADNPHLRAHILQEGMCAYIDNNELIIHHGQNILRLGNLGPPTAITQDLLPAVLAGLLCNIPHQDIACYLSTLLSGLDTELRQSQLQ